MGQQIPFKILIVDDEHDMRVLNGDAVRAAGFEPILAASSLEALTLVQTHERDLAAVLSDFHMPDEDGFALRAKLLPKYRDIPFIILSGLVSREMALEGVNLKIAAFLDKPISRPELLTVLTRETEHRIAFLNERRAIEATFYEEAHSILDELEQLILSLEANPSDMDAVNAIFRYVHTLKGSSGVLGIQVFYEFLHWFEDLLASLRGHQQKVTPQIIAGLLRGHTLVKDMIVCFERGEKPALDLQSLIKQIEQEINAAAGNHASKQEPVATTALAVEARAETIKVATSELDEFMELNGEITVIRNMVNKLVRSIEKSQPGNKDVSLLAKMLEEMHKINSTLQSRIVDLRKVAVGSSLRPLKRTIRDLAVSLNKKLELRVINEGLHVDTAIAQVLSESLIHLLRNSADHGIETPEERRTTGKPPTGTITISSREENDEIVVALADDGRGIDAERIRKKLVDSGRVSAELGATMPSERLLATIFEPGFSTSAAVSNVSGRGVGMDAVKSAVERVGGRIDITTELHHGTTFTLRLPIPKSVLIINSLLIGIEDQTFAIPQDRVLRLLQLNPSQEEDMITRLEGGSVLTLQGSILPIVELADVLAIRPQSQRVRAASEPTDLNLVVLKGDHSTFAMTVGTILDGEEVVVKPIGKHLANLQCFNGATFLGDGRIGLILDIAGIEKRVGIEGAKDEATAGSATVTIADAKDDYLLFSLHDQALYGIPLDQVYRLEEITKAATRYSGEQLVVVYRDDILPLHFFGALTGRPAPEEFALDDTVNFIVFAQDSRKFGLIVESIHEVYTGKLANDRCENDPAWFKGHLIVDAEVACIVDAQEALITAGLLARHEEEASITPLPVQGDGAISELTEKTQPAVANWGIFE